jgi:hypothetical protein
VLCDVMFYHLYITLAAMWTLEVKQ